ncbi:uncharacterized protein LOC117011391 [Catharus ustulatus]|uniref:uncharacterized protein LOC117011391 n=1 Tax=Catharus ustulatus TaxID=91951 RepID=UPI001C5B8F05|nr:uncharacterized protein LOC117011391 [Catharus ustulatus]
MAAGGLAACCRGQGGWAGPRRFRAGSRRVICLDWRYKVRAIKDWQFALKQELGLLYPRGFFFPVILRSCHVSIWLAHSCCVPGTKAAAEAPCAKRDPASTFACRTQYVVEEVNPDDWCNLLKTGLEYSYRDETFLKVLNVAIPLLYKKESSLSQSLVKLSKLHVMITQRSLFLSTILRSIEEDGTTIQTREALVDIVLTAVQLSSSLCGSSHLPVLLGAYGATLSAAGECQPGQGTSFCISFLCPQVTSFGFNLGF